MYNWSYWMDNFFNLSMQGYTNTLGFLLWPVIIMGVTGYVYLKTQSVVAFAVAVLLCIVAFGSNVLADPSISIWYNLMYTLVLLAFTGLILLFISKVRR